MLIALVSLLPPVETFSFELVLLATVVRYTPPKSIQGNEVTNKPNQLVDCTV